MYDRREFLEKLGTAIPLGLALATLAPLGKNGGAAIAAPNLPPEQIATNESYWAKVQQAFTVDRSIINLNNGGVSPAPAYVQQAMKRHLDFSNNAPAYTMWKVLEPQREGVRHQLARLFNCDNEEIALTRNASEGLQICQLGFDLKAGDEVLTTTQDYGRMINTFKQRERREGIVLKQFQIPIPAEDDDAVVALFEENITAKTRLILISHMINLTGQILPVKRVVQMARRRGIPVIVDGAHSFAHFPFQQQDLDCDYFATSLHKWLFAPHGTGMLYVKKDKIEGLWPMTPADEDMDDDIRKFEEIGTHPAANYLAIAEAVTFHEGIGEEAKIARLIYLRDRWAKRLMANERVKLHTSLKAGLAGGFANVEIEGIRPGKLARHLWKKHQIIVTPINHPEFDGIRVSPSVYTTVAEIDRFSEALETVIKKGLPTT